jgi:hypothetical protein
MSLPTRSLALLVVGAVMVFAALVAILAAVACRLLLRHTGTNRC